MRSLWSFLATTNSAPSSIFLRPIFQASATRIEYCSMVSGAVVGTISTATWLPFLASRDLRVCVSEAISSLESVPVWSTTRPERGGTATSAAAAKAQHIPSARMQALAAFIAANLELICGRGGRWNGINLRGAPDCLFRVDREDGLLPLSQQHRR